MKAGLIGTGIAGSLTPAMHEAEGKAQGLDYGYTRFDTGAPPWAGMKLADILDTAERAGFSGVNITHPFKTEAAARADTLVGAAAALGAVNTMLFQGGRRLGHNTDYAGFRAALDRDLAGAAFGAVLLVGAGGAGTAVAHALIDHGVGRLAIHDRKSAAARRLAATLARTRPEVRVVACDTEAGIDFRAIDGVVNATPIGMDGHPGTAIDVARLPADAWVADIVYFPLETALLSQARARGHRVMSGAGMAVFQAVGSFELFTGRSADAARMTAHFDRLEDDNANRRAARD